jgi:Fe2+ transport system protein FeoA
MLEGEMMASKPLHELESKEKGKVVRVGGKGAIRRRLLDMGLVTGAEVEMERVAPLGDPIQVKIKGYHLTLRKEEAASIWIDVP